MVNKAHVIEIPWLFDEENRRTEDGENVFF